MNAKSFNYLMALILVMFAGSYAAVPLYQLLCQQTGLAGTTTRQDHSQTFQPPAGQSYGGVPNPTVEANPLIASPDPCAPTTQPVLVRFEAQVLDLAPVIFQPACKEVEVSIGQPTLVFYQLANLSDRELRFIATYNITPYHVGNSFIKIECFCFDEQRIKPSERVDLPLLFYLLPPVPASQQPSFTGPITLSYSLYLIP